MVVINKQWKTGKARKEVLRKVINKIAKGRRVRGPGVVGLRWVKSQIGIKDKREEDRQAKLREKEEDGAFLLITKVGLKETWKRIRKRKDV